MRKEYINGVEFVIGKSKKFDKDFVKAEKLLTKKCLTATDRMELLSIYATSYHDDGKIEGFTSCDSSCHGCEFCQKMIESAKQDPTLICGYCYDHAQENRWINTRNRHGLNLLIMSVTDYTEDELSRLSVTEFTRINSSGETLQTIFSLAIISALPTPRSGLISATGRRTEDLFCRQSTILESQRT